MIGITQSLTNPLASIPLEASSIGADSAAYRNSLDKVNWLRGYLTEHNINL